eukprot:Skav207748  [mRNA]  locus=scaffold181:39899:45862:- [translate_table: standard]
MGSWAMCQGCSSVQPRRLTPSDFKQVAPPTITEKACTACKHGEYVPQIDDIPLPLRDLPPAVIAALRPLDVNAGPDLRAQHGYRVHACMITFSWAPISVKQKIKELDRQDDRKLARAAHRHLLKCRDSNYSAFHQRHQDFLRKHGEDAPETKRLECALWPHLYWHRNLCETVVRASHESRAGKKRKASSSSADEEDDQEEGPNIQCSKMGRIRRSFMRKFFSPVIGYGTDYELLHFVYDLSMWTTVGTKKNVASRHDVPLRLVLRGCPWSPQYFRVRHLAVIDMQRQCGNAALFRTRAPYEKSFPYHMWIMHEQRLAGRSRLHLAGAETLHHAHVLTELDKAFICGSRRVHGRRDRNWTKHLLAAEVPDESGNYPETVLGRFTRLEFQDGKRKPATQSYHGKGTTHSHSLEYLQNMDAIGLEHKISAHLPDKESQPLLHGLVLDGQCDRTNSGVPLREEPSVWDPTAEKLLLQHAEEDRDLHIRPYFPRTMEITKCHEDVQFARDNGAVLHYVATYAFKFSDSMDKDWLTDHASDYSVARRILFSHHPLEPEMWLTLAAERFPQVDYKGSLVDIFVPLPNCSKKPKWLVNYEESAWRADSMPLIAFLRKSNQNGEILRHIKEAYHRYVCEEVEKSLLAAGQPEKQAKNSAAEMLKAYKRRVKEGEEETLTTYTERRFGVEVEELHRFANDYIPRGEKLIAAGTYSMLNDRYYGHRIQSISQELSADAMFASRLFIDPDSEFVLLGNGHVWPRHDEERKQIIMRALPMVAWQRHSGIVACLSVFGENIDTVTFSSEAGERTYHVWYDDDIGLAVVRPSRTTLVLQADITSEDNRVKCKFTLLSGECIAELSMTVSRRKPLAMGHLTMVAARAIYERGLLESVYQEIRVLLPGFEHCVPDGVLLWEGQRGRPRGREAPRPAETLPAALERLQALTPAALRNLDRREVDALEAAARAETAELRNFFRQHRCPSEDAILKWFEEEGIAYLRRSGTRFLLNDFDYEAFKTLWEAPALDEEEARRSRREVGEKLHRHGGFASMQMHHYALHFALCSGAFIDREALSVVIVSSGRDLEHDWHGIGEWRE